MGEIKSREKISEAARICRIYVSACLVLPSNLAEMENRDTSNSENRNWDPGGKVYGREEYGNSNSKYLLCLFRKPWRGSLCEYSEWFHDLLMNVSSSQALHIDRGRCPGC